MRRLPLLPFLLLALCLSACGSTARTAPAAAPAAEAPLPLPTPLPSRDGPAPVPVYLDGLLRLRGYDCGGTLWLCPEDVCALFDIEASSAADGTGFRLVLPQWTLEAPGDSPVWTAAGRWLYCPEGFREIDGRVCVPPEIIERLFGLGVSFGDGSGTLDASAFRLFSGGPDYYHSAFPAEDLFWLCRIIHSESRWEPLEGQIGVGNVVLNRVASDRFPDSVMAVVLDREHVIQFDPVGTGEVLAEPDEQSVLAACLCLEGYNTVGDSLYFVNPERGDPTWFDRDLTHTVTIGHHAFYS